MTYAMIYNQMLVELATRERWRVAIFPLINTENERSGAYAVYVRTLQKTYRVSTCGELAEAVRLTRELMVG